MISMIKPDDKDFQRYRFTISEFRDMAGVSGDGYYKRIKEITKGLLDRGLVLKEPDGDLQISWISSAKYYDQEGYVDLSFDPALKPYLLDIQEKFTLYQLKNIIKLRSRYSIRIYEIAKRYQFIKEWIFKLDELRDSLGIGPGKYSRYNDFKKDVLEKAKSELAKKTDVKFQYKEIKKGRKITSIKFTVRKNSKYKNKASDNHLPKSPPGHDQIPTPILALIPEQYRPLVVDTVKEYLIEKGFEYVKRNVLYTNSMDYQNYPKYLKVVLRKDFGKDFIPEDPEFLSKQGFQKQIAAEGSKKRLQDYESILKKEAEQKRLLKSLAPEQYEELTKLAIRKLNSYDMRRYKMTKNKEEFPPIERNRLSMVENFIKVRKVIK